MVFIGLEKAYDRVPRERMGRTLKKKQVHSSYIETINMCDRVTTAVRTIRGHKNKLSITIDVESFFATIMDEITRHILEKVPWCMMFAEDIVLVD